MNSVIVIAQGTTISIDSQTTKTFGNYVKTLVKFHNFAKTMPDYIFINLHGKTTSSTTGHLIVYGVKGFFPSVEPKVYDTAFVVENGKMAYQIIPFDCILNEITAFFPSLESDDNRITLNVRSIAKNNISQSFNSSSNERIQVFSSGINLSKNVMYIYINKMNVAGGIITHYEAVFGLTFTPR